MPEILRKYTPAPFSATIWHIKRSEQLPFLFAGYLGRFRERTLELRLYKCYKARLGI